MKRLCLVLQGNSYFMKSVLFVLALCLPVLSACSASADDILSDPAPAAQVYTSIYWSDGDSGRLGKLKFRLANIDAPETGSLKQRGGAKCEAEREIGYDAKAFIVEFTRGKAIEITGDYGEDRYDRLVVDLTADGVDVAKSAVDAGHLRPWPHIKGRAQAPKPDWCAP